MITSNRTPGGPDDVPGGGIARRCIHTKLTASGRAPVNPSWWTCGPATPGSNTAADHKQVLAAALAQLPWQPGYRVGRKALVRTDAGGGTHEFVAYCAARRLQYSLGFTLTEALVEAVNAVPKHVWTPAYDAEGQVREGAWVAEITDMADLCGWPEGMRLIVREERPHPGAQLRFTDVDGLRLTAFVTNTGHGQLPDLELRHRRRARYEDRIRAARTPGCAICPSTAMKPRLVRKFRPHKPQTSRSGAYKQTTLQNVSQVRPGTNGLPRSARVARIVHRFARG
ncbi:hypothetical protein F5544_30370 [Nocardia arthritidis]|uniref:Transposase DDE domain-containing protein n=1 Tax=Nocardia arthritidis TaxID=228602 RepID=A0A6G9YL44_9NOCA|nr:hypothetical protein F5544_30370 [Nocardia arthritidis]